MPSWRVLAAIGILAIQLASVLNARLSTSRYFAWAIFDTNTQYQITVTRAGERLQPPAIFARYQTPPRGFEGRSIQHLFEIIAQYETTYGAGEGAQVEVRYRIDGGAEQAWQWPR